jgi:rubrerythrin
MTTLKGTQTEKNILTAFAGESQARNRYTYFASKAKKEGYVQISTIFEETANQEKEHAKRLFKLLEGGEVEISASFPHSKTCRRLLLVKIMSRLLCIRNLLKLLWKKDSRMLQPYLWLLL